MAKMLPRTLPVVLSGEDISRLLAATRNIKHQVALTATRMLWPIGSTEF